jgi:NADH-quinone oxidoreductase subunit H
VLADLIRCCSVCSPSAAADRKIWAAVQMRRGPNVVGPFGLLQSFADLLKFVLKEPSSRRAPTRSSSCWRRWSPSCWPAAWAVIPVGPAG